MNIGVFVGAMERLPRGYGVAYRCWNRDGAMCYPVPLNRLVRYWRVFVEWLSFPETKTRVEREQIEAYRRGYDRGVATGEYRVRSSLTREYDSLRSTFGADANQS